MTLALGVRACCLAHMQLLCFLTGAHFTDRSEAQVVQVQQLQLQFQRLKTNHAWTLADWQNAKTVSAHGCRAVACAPSGCAVM
jgi:hypothetical protein